jgi:hypothetical protein
MPRIDSRKLRNGIFARESAKARVVGGRKNGYIHVISPATASEIQRAIGIKPSHIKNVLRAFSEAGIKV